MTGLRLWPVACAWRAGVPMLALACAHTAALAACPLPDTALRQGAVQATWSIDPAPIVVGRHFTIRVQLCPHDAVLARVDAWMPAHRHGMNYRPSVQALGDGRWQADGLMFHMPGAWELRLDVTADGRMLTLRDAVTMP